jgi:hypothetical protein
MAWKFQQHKTFTAQQDIKVSMLVKEMSTYSYLYTSEDFNSTFKERLKEIKRTNNFSADHLFKANLLTHNKIEIWKLNVQGDFKTKMFTLDYQKPSFKKVYDGDNLKEIETFNQENTDEVVKRLEDSGKWDEVGVDIEGDIICYTY